MPTKQDEQFIRQLSGEEELIIKMFRGYDPGTMDELLGDRRMPLILYLLHDMLTDAMGEGHARGFNEGTKMPRVQALS
ncbi:MAG: hypothetical protein AAF828_01575 [Bacteroidota bacterium]